MLHFRQITQFCFRYQLLKLKHKMSICSEHLGVGGPLGPPGYAYACAPKQIGPIVEVDLKLLLTFMSLMKICR